MRQVFLAFALLLVYTSVSKAAPIADDEIMLPFRYPVWWRPNEVDRSFWDPLIARLLWTHPAFRRYYKELAGWESSNWDTDRPSLLTILNEYEENEPFMSATYKEDNRGENYVDEEHPIDKREEPQEEPTSEPDADMETTAESEHRQNNGDSENQSNKNSEDNRESENSTDDGEIADRKRRSYVASETQLLWRSLLRRSRLGEHGVNSDRQLPRITAGEFADLLHMNVEDLISQKVATSPDDELPVNSELLRTLNIQVKLEELVRLLLGPDGLLRELLDDGLLGQVLGDNDLLGGVLRRLPSGSYDRLNRPSVYRHTAAFGERTANRESASGDDGVVEPVPAPRILNKIILDNVGDNQLLDDLGIVTMRVHVRSADPDCTTEQTTDDDDSDSGGSPLVKAEVLTGDTPLVESRKKRSVNSISVARLESGGD